MGSIAFHQTQSGSLPAHWLLDVDSGRLNAA
jgi:hypothetical protein